MHVTHFTKPKAIVTLVFALIFIVDANLILPLFGFELESGGVMIARFLGGAYLGTGIGLWQINSHLDISPNSAWQYCLGDVIGALACVIACLGGVMNPGGWLLAIIFLGSASGFAWIASQNRIAMA